MNKEELVKECHKTVVEWFKMQHPGWNGVEYIDIKLSEVYSIASKRFAVSVNYDSDNYWQYSSNNSIEWILSYLIRTINLEIKEFKLKKMIT